MAQPDLGRLAQNIRNAGDGLQTASTELTLLENLPSIHDRQAAHNNHQELVGLIQHLTTRVDTVERGLNTRLDNVNTRLDHVNTRLDNLDARVTVLDARVTVLDARVTVNQNNLIARSLNSSVNIANVQLSPLRTSDNQDVAGFPDTMHALNNMNGTQIDHLLRVFALPVNGNLDIKKRRFQSYIGVPWGVEGFRC